MTTRFSQPATNLAVALFALPRENRRGLLGCARRSVLALIAALFLAPAAAAWAQSPPSVPVHFSTLPPHAQLPSGAQCAAWIAPAPWEPRPENFQANHDRPSPYQLDGFYVRPVKGNFVPPGDFARVDGDFSGTTDQILRWGACKWGVDEDVVRAEAAAESHWRQSAAGDPTTNLAWCPPGTGFIGAWDGTRCMQSYGIMQVKFRDFGGWPLSRDSTAFNVDFRLAYQRACMNGDIDYLPARMPQPGYPRYPDGDTQGMLWGCMGDWYSGGWFDPPALGYVAQVKEILEQRSWLHGKF
jgi:hypothetical protein